MINYTKKTYVKYAKIWENYCIGINGRKQDFLSILMFVLPVPLLFGTTFVLLLSYTNSMVVDFATDGKLYLVSALQK
jgi:hypothetical protein